MLRAVRVAVVAICAVVLSAGCSATATKSLHVDHRVRSRGRRAGTAQCNAPHWRCPSTPTRPDGEHISLALARRPASGKRIGVLLTNPGGPGGSGVEFLENAAQRVRARDPAAVRHRLVGSPWRRRERAGSLPRRSRRVLRGRPDAAGSAAVAAERRGRAQQFVAVLRAAQRRELADVSTSASVHDMDAIRAAIGETTISYLGFSYGTFLGARYADAYPQHVRTMVLDGAVDPSLDAMRPRRSRRRRVSSDVLDAFFVWCRRTRRCGFARGGDPADAFDRLERAVAAEPTPATVDGEQRTLGPGEFDIGVASALVRAAGPGFRTLARRAGRDGRGSGDQLLALADEYTERQPGGKYSNQTAAFYAIGCLDAPSPRTVAACAAPRRPGGAGRARISAPRRVMARLAVHVLAGARTSTSRPRCMPPARRRSSWSARPTIRPRRTHGRSRSRSQLDPAACSRSRATATPRTAAATRASTTRSTTICSTAKLPPAGTRCPAP